MATYETKRVILNKGKVKTFFIEIKKKHLQNSSPAEFIATYVSKWAAKVKGKKTKEKN